MATFDFEGHGIAYTEYAAEGRSKIAAGRPIVLIHGLLLSQQMYQPLAEDLAARGNRVITIDLLGHGESNRPRDMRLYAMPLFASQVIALLDHLGIDQAVVMGCSLGANTTLEVALAAPARVRAMVVEMPVLDKGLLPSALFFTPVFAALALGEPVLKLYSKAARAVPRRMLPHFGNVALDVVRQEPGPSGAVVRGLFFGRIAPNRSERRTFEAPALVLGHRRDPIHPFTDADTLADDLPNGRLVEANSILELRLQPQRLTEEIASFLDEVWAPRQKRRLKRRSAAPASKRIAPAREDAA